MGVVVGRQTLSNLVGGETGCRPGSSIRNIGRAFAHRMVVDSGPMAEVRHINPGFFNVRT